MTSRDWQADRRAVFDRDDHTCRHCETTGDADDPTTLRTSPVGAVPLEGTVHESALVTVCDGCFETVSASSTDSTTPTSRRELFELVRETTRSQGGAISDVASFASLATSLPATLLDDAATTTADETAGEYCDARRTVLLEIDIAEASLERVLETDGTALDAGVNSSLETFSAAATSLQSTLRATVDLAETVPAGLERCRGCFGALEAGSCPTCGLEAPATADWRRDDGDLAFDRLFAAINDELQDASATTETLTDRATALATRLSDG